MHRIFQRSDLGPHGTMLKVIPMTDEHVVNKMSCFKNEGEEDAPVEPQSILPDLEGFELKGLEMANALLNAAK